jgi:hypothetical protein
MVEWKTMITMFQDKRKMILCVIILLGIVLRFLPGLQTDFPLNDGGMFLSMIQDLRANQYLIPAATNYNYSDIPYAYPPFGIYIAAILSGVFSISDIAILRWLPAIMSAAIIPVFYWLSLQIFDSKPKAFIAAALYALLPTSFDWLVMGGGLTRSFGILFSLLAFGHVYRLFRDGLRTEIWWSILFCALAVLSHPEVGLQTAAICFLMWLFFGRSPAGLKNAMLVSLGTVLLTAPWWLTVLIQHGFAPFESAMQTGVRETLLASLFHSFFSMQGSLPILPVLSLLGIWVAFRKRDFLLFAWAFLPFFADPRNAPAVSTFPFILLSSEGLYFLKEEFERAYLNTMGNKKDTLVRPSIWTTAIFSVLLIYLFIISFNSTGNLPHISLKESDRETMTWIRENLPVESRFLLITNAGQISPMADSYQEWFPVLAERQSRNTLQGTEWTLGLEFFPYSQQLVALQSCPDADCLHEWTKSNSVQVEYVLVQTERASPDLIASLRSDEHYQMVYESATTVIFKFIQ